MHVATYYWKSYTFYGITTYVAIHTMNIINLIYPTIGICKEAKPVEQGVTTFTKT